MERVTQTKPEKTHKHISWFHGGVKKIMMNYNGVVDLSLNLMGYKMLLGDLNFDGEHSCKFLDYKCHFKQMLQYVL